MLKKIKKNKQQEQYNINSTTFCDLKQHIQHCEQKHNGWTAIRLLVMSTSFAIYMQCSSIGCV